MPHPASPSPSLSVLVPAFNEAASIAACVRRIAAVALPPAEVLVIDGGHDDTETLVATVAHELGEAPGPRVAIRYLRNHGDRGKGHAIRRGIAEARGQVMAQLDADLQFLPEDLPRLIAPILAGTADVTLGSRFAPGAVRAAGGVAPARHLGNRAVSAYVSLLFGQRMTDVLAGMKAWSRQAIAVIAPTCDGFSYEIEIPARALRRGLRVVDVPVTTQARTAGASHVRALPVGLRLLRDATRWAIFDRG